MSDRYLDNLLPDFGDYSVESYLDSYRKRGTETDPSEAAPAEQAAPAQTAQSIAQRSRQIVMEALGETFSQAQSAPEEPSPDEDGLPESTEDIPEKSPAKKAPHPELKKARSNRVHIGDDGVITLEFDMPEAEASPVNEPEPEPTEEALPEEEPVPSAEEEQPPRSTSRPQLRRVIRATEQPVKAVERFLAPLVRFAATAIARRQMQRAEAANWPEPVEYRETDELPPKKASGFYANQLRPLRFRLRVCVFLCAVLAWISLRLPMAGMLGYSLTVQAGVSLVLMMTVMMATLDILAAGMRQLFELRPGAEAIVTLAALMSCVDGAMVVAGYGSQLPFCAVGAFSLCAALWGEKLECTARARSMRTAAISKSPSAVTAEETERGSRYICRTAGPIKGIVRRSEQPDFCQTTYAAAAPILLGVSVVLAALASTNGQGAYFLHTLSALLSVSASFTAFLSFPLPYSLTSRKLQASGAAIIGYAGCADIGRIRQVVVSDVDLFPPGNIKFTGINVADGAPVDKVVSYTTSMLAASGSGVTGVFMELVTRRGYDLVNVDEFRCHEGGGLSARVNDEQVLVGSAGFMNLMGIRLPQNMKVKNAVCTAISGELVGVFTLEYIPVTSVQDALVTLLQGRIRPIFAIRDFNITPLMIRQLFRIPTDNFNFPTFRDRYRIAASAFTSEGPVTAVLSRGGMGPMVDAAETGRRLYSTCRTGTIISLVGTGIGLLIMFLLCRAGSYDTATAGNVLSYMLLWALPVVFMAVGQSR